LPVTNISINQPSTKEKTTMQTTTTQPVPAATPPVTPAVLLNTSTFYSTYHKLLGSMVETAALLLVIYMTANPA
jgi:hypothetical protein